MCCGAESEIQFSLLPLDIIKSENIICVKIICEAVAAYGGVSDRKQQNAADNTDIRPDSIISQNARR